MSFEAFAVCIFAFGGFMLACVLLCGMVKLLLHLFGNALPACVIDFLNDVIYGQEDRVS